MGNRGQSQRGGGDDRSAKEDALDVGHWIM